MKHLYNLKKKFINTEKYSNGIIFILTIFAFQFALGLYKVNPINISWLFETRNDLATNQIGWSFFRDSAWQFPLGTINNYYYPIGTNIGFTDSIPLLAILFKLLWFLLPENFQYIGIWLLLCMFLNGYYSFKIFKHFKINKIMSYLFVILILLNPIFLFRQGHAALCAQWLLIGSIYLYVCTEKNSDVYKKLKHYLVLLFLSCFITPYLTVVVFGFLVIFLIKLFFYDARIHLKKAIIYLFSSLAIIFCSWVSIGLIDFSKHTTIASSGFYGAYKMNLNSLYNSMGYSKFLPAQELISGYQQDSFMYLGLGFMILILFSLVFLIIQYAKSKKLFFNKKLIPLMVFCVVISVFAATNNLSFNNNEIFTIPFLGWISKIGDIFRASGRFFWSVYYLMIFYFIIVFNKIPLGKILKIALVSFLLLIQVADISPMFNKQEVKHGDYKPALNIKFWNVMFSNFKNVITVMPFNNDLVNFQDYQEIAFFAYKNKTSVTNGNLARYDGEIAQEFTNNLIKEIIVGKLSKDNLYISSKENLKYFGPAFSRGLIKIINSDGYYFIYSNAKQINNLQDNLPKDKLEFERAKKENLIASEFKLSSTSLPKSSGEIKSNFENELYSNSIIQVKGWAFVENSTNNTGDSIFVYLKNDNYLYKKHCVQTERKDITIVYKKENLDNSGFENFAFTNNLEKGKYELILVIKDKKGDFYYSNSKKTINIGFDEFIIPTKWNTSVIKNQNLGLGIDSFEFKNNILSIKGWAAYKEFESKNSTVEVLLINNNTMFKSETLSNIRKDVTESLKNNINYDDSGFEAKIDARSLPKATYTIGIRVTNQTNKKDSYILSEKKLKVN